MSFAGQKLDSSYFAYVRAPLSVHRLFTASRNGQDDLIGILTPRVGYSMTGNGDRRAELYTNKHMRGRTGHPVIFRMACERKI